VLILAFRLAMGWIFFHAGLSQILTPHFSVTGFLSRAKTFHYVFAVFMAPAVAPLVSFAVEWGQLLIGLSLILGVRLRLSAPFGIALMLMFYAAQMQFPYVGGPFYMIVDPHLIFALVLVYLMITQEELERK